MLIQAYREGEGGRRIGMIGRCKGDFGGRAGGASIPLLLTPVKRYVMYASRLISVHFTIRNSFGPIIIESALLSLFLYLYRAPKPSFTDSV